MRALGIVEDDGRHQGLADLDPGPQRLRVRTGELCLHRDYPFVPEPDACLCARLHLQYLLYRPSLAFALAKSSNPFQILPCRLTRSRVDGIIQERRAHWPRFVA